ncbi:MAG: hypothetical protein NVS3B2_01870 [Ramlibacter sp.]
MLAAVSSLAVATEAEPPHSPPQNPLRQAQRLQGLAGEMSSLRARALQQRDDIGSLRESLRGVHNQPDVRLAVTVLLAMLAGGTGAFLSHRLRRPRGTAAVESWYGSIDPPAYAQDDVDDEPQALPTGVLKSRPATPLSTAQLPVQGAVAGAAPRPVAAAVRPALELPTPALARAAPDSGATPLPETQGHKVDALHGAQQQAEFFGSLGQFDEAVAVLNGYLDGSDEQPVLAFLELFRLCHGSGMRAQYEALQSRFRKTFGMDVMGFSQYKEDERELELYPMAIKRIAAAWPSAASQQVIEDLLFSKPATPRALLSLHALRELLWLYGLGQALVYATDSPAELPWTIDEQQDQSVSLERLGSIDVARGSDAFAIDVDLTAVHELGARAAEPAPATEPAPLARPDEANAFDLVMESASRRRSGA